MRSSIFVIRITPASVLKHRGGNHPVETYLPTRALYPSKCVAVKWERQFRENKAGIKWQKARKTAACVAGEGQNRRTVGRRAGHEDLRREGLERPQRAAGWHNSAEEGRQQRERSERTPDVGQSVRRSRSTEGTGSALRCCWRPPSWARAVMPRRSGEAAKDGGTARRRTNDGLSCWRKLQEAAKLERVGD